MYPIEIENLTVTFGERVLFDAFYLRVERGEKVMVSGPSGGGKTVLLRCIIGLEIPRRGVIRLGLARTCAVGTCAVKPLQVSHYEALT